MRYHGSNGAERIRVRLSAQDPISYAGLAGQLRPCPELRLLGEQEETDQATVVVVALDRVGEEEVQTLRQLRRGPSGRIVLVGTDLDDAGLVAAVECGVVGVVRRTEATADRLVQTILAAARGEGTVPADLLGRLLEQVGRLQRQVLDPRGLAFSGLSTREVEVLRLVAAGHDTAEIAEALSFSERTVKNVLHEITTRLQLRNRSHAVAYAMREGFI
ncbi:MULTISPECIES: response regulator transcription factor [Kitasatospora]|uniref:DNA-binding NarL/FixJ family response regulator n=2 Tax=Kitasatospora TaxID=2063 RepID=A0ABT1IVP5_9ACTN|nr:response regulator transcription factor [Kitasatospora paracochleata]MCP2309139.1 DNA-binding NarL/FixJ family response regulator [Kitasatospora paracochleata]